MATVKTNTIIHKAGSSYQLTSLQKEAKNNNSNPTVTESVVVSNEDIPSADMVYVIPGEFKENGDFVAPTGKAYNPVKVATSGGGGSATATPTFSSQPGTVPEGTKITITCATPGATIHYTTDGTDATLSSPVYTAGTPISVDDEGVTIKAVAVVLGMATSAQASGYFTTAVSPDPTQYYLGWLVAKTDAPVTALTAAELVKMPGLMQGKAVGADSPDPTIFVAPSDVDVGVHSDIVGARMVYAYPKKFGEIKFFTDGLGKHPITDSYEKLELNVDSTPFYAFVLRDVIAPDTGDELIQRFTAN